jgi:hypothetical protein
VTGTDATVVKTGGLTLLAVEVAATGTVLEDVDGNVLLVTLLAFGKLAVEAAAIVALTGGADGGGIVIVPLALGAALARSETSCELLDTGIEVTVGTAPDRLVEMAETETEGTADAAADKLLATEVTVPVVEARRLSTVVVETGPERIADATPDKLLASEPTAPVAGAAKPVVSELTVPVVELSTLLTAVVAAAGAISGSPVLFKPATGALMAVPKLPPALRTCAN